MPDINNPTRGRKFARMPKSNRDEASASEQKALASAPADPAGIARAAHDAVVIGEGANLETTAAHDTPATDTSTSQPAMAESKISNVMALLQRAEGATLAELVATTGWLPHTTRAALTGLKKKGHVITRGKRDDVTCYHVADAG